MFDVLPLISTYGCQVQMLTLNISCLCRPAYASYPVDVSQHMPAVDVSQHMPAVDVSQHMPAVDVSWWMSARGCQAAGVSGRQSVEQIISSRFVFTSAPLPQLSPLMQIHLQFGPIHLLLLTYGPNAL